MNNNFAQAQNNMMYMNNNFAHQQNNRMYMNNNFIQQQNNEAFSRNNQMMQEILQEMKNNNNNANNLSTFPEVIFSNLSNDTNEETILQAVKYGMDKFPNDDKEGTRYIDNYLNEIYIQYTWIVIGGKNDSYNLGFIVKNIPNAMIIHYLNLKIVILGVTKPNS